MNLDALLRLLARALDEARCTPPERTLTLHWAERDGKTQCAAVYDELRVSREWAA